MWTIFFNKYLPALCGALFLAISDVATNDNAATLLKLHSVAIKITGMPEIQGGTIGLFVMLIAAAFLVWMKDPQTRENSFMLGLSVFTVLMVATPYKSTKDDTNQQLINQARSISLITTAYAQNNSVGRETQFIANAKIIRNTAVSSCKPYFLGFMGITSLLNNQVGFCSEPYRLNADSAVKVKNCWLTTLRTYRYVEIDYMHQGIVKSGWIPDGQHPQSWTTLLLTSETQVPSSCKNQ